MAASSPSSNVLVVQSYLAKLQAYSQSDFPHFSPDFSIFSNGRMMGLADFKERYMHLAGMLAEAHFQVLDIFGSHDRVATWRRVSPIATKAGTQQPALGVIEVWTVRDGLIVAGEQCWQKLPGPAADDLPMTPRESVAAEAVRSTLEGMQRIASIQDHLTAHCAPSFSGCIDGNAYDLPAWRAHWAALEAELGTLLVDIKELLVHGSSVGVVYHMLFGLRDRRLAELRMVAVYRLDDQNKIVHAESVSRLLSGDAGDELLACLGMRPEPQEA